MLLGRRGVGYPRVRRPVFGDESEKSFMARVTQLARLRGWLDWHTLDSTGTRAGEPDLRLVRPPRVIFAELKSQHGRLRIEQAAALALLEQCPGVETYVWRPSDWQTVMEVLR
jgi:hypothetical protein